MSREKPCYWQCFLKHSTHWRMTSIDQWSTNWTSSTEILTSVPCRTSSQLLNPNQRQHPALQTSIQLFFSNLCIHARHLLLSTSLKPSDDTKDLSSLTVRPCKPLPTVGYHSTNLMMEEGSLHLSQTKLHRYVTMETHQYLHPKLVLENKALGQLILYIRHRSRL